jgi:drug/metabolite transporter (DMT)-like permease
VPSADSLRANLAAGRDHHAAPLVGATVATVLWSMGNLMARGASLPGPQLAFWRVLFGAVVYQAVFHARGGRMSRATFRTAALGGVAFGLSASLFFTALKLTTVASATVIAALQPVLLLPYTTRRMGERVDRTRLVLTAVAVTGTVVVVLGSSSSGTWSPIGDLLAFLGTLVGCAYFVGTKRARESLDTLEYQAAALPIGAVVALAGALVTGPGLVSPTPADLGWAALMMAVPGTGHLLMSWAQKHLDVTTTATIALDVTVLSSLGAVVVFGQALSAVQVAGMVVVIGALALYVRHSAGRPAADPAEVGVVPGE